MKGTTVTVVWRTRNIPIFTKDARSTDLDLWDWFTIGMLFLGYATYYLCRSNLAVCSTQMIEQHASEGFDKLAYGSLVSWGTAGYALGKLLSGRLGDLLGGKRVFLAAMAISGALTVFFGSAGASAFVGIWCLNRFVQSSGWPALMSLATRWYPYSRRAAVAGFLSMSYLLGDAAVRFGLGRLMEVGWDWREIFHLAGWAAVGMAFFSLPLVRPPGFAEPNRVDAAPDAITSSEGSILGAILTRVDFWVVCGLSCGLTVIRETFNNWTPLFLREVVGMDQAGAAKGSSVFPLIGALAVWLAGWLTGRIGNRHGLVSAVSLAGLTAALLVIGRAPLQGRPELALALLAASSMLLLGPYSFCAGVMAMELGGKRAAATVSGWVDAAGYVGGIVAGYGVATVTSWFGWRTAFEILAGITSLMVAASIGYAIASRNNESATPRDTDSGMESC